MKNIEWLKKEIPNLRGYAVIIDGEDGEWEPVTTVSMEDIYELINQLDKLEVLSQEWIDEHRESTFDLDLDEDFETLFIKVEDLQNLLVPKQEITEEQAWEKISEYYPVKQAGLKSAFEHFYYGGFMTDVVAKKPAIPKFVAEIIEEHKELGYDVYDSIDLIIETNGEGLPSISDWVAKNIDKYARAWLDGFTVEEEQLFYVVGKDNTAILSKGNDGNPYPREGVFSDYFVGHEDYMLTEQEIKDYDPRYMTFAKPIEELEAH